MENKNILGERIKERKKALHLSNIELADRMGIDKSTFSNWVTGHRKPEIKNLPLLANALKTSADYLLGMKDDYRLESDIPVKNHLYKVKTTDKDDYIISEINNLSDFFPIAKQMYSVITSVEYLGIVKGK